MGLVRTSLLNGIAVVVKMGTGLVLNKVIAVYVGPTGYAIIGQLQNLISIVSTFAAGAVNTGVIKYTAEFSAEPIKLRSLWQTAGTITISGSLLVGLVLASFRNDLAVWLLGDARHSPALGWLAVCLIFISLNALLLAILAGQKDVRRYIVASIAGSFVGLGLSTFLAWRFGLTGVLVALSATQAISCFATLIICRNLYWCRMEYLWGAVDVKVARKLSRFIFMALTTAAAVPVTQIFVRTFIGDTFGVTYAGYWDAINKISIIYLTLVTTTLSLYYLPRISEIKKPCELRQEIWYCFKIIFPLTVAASTFLYVVRVPLVGFLFSDEFQPMAGLMGWQVIGDVLKISSWLLAYVVIGKGMSTIFVVTEVLFSISLYLITVFLSKLIGIDGITAAYALNYAFYLTTMYWLVLIRPQRPGIN